MILFGNAKKLLFFVLVIISLNPDVLGKEKATFKKSYYGSILSGQIANYNNEAGLASEYFNFANELKPENIKIYNLALMSLILNGKVDEAIDKIKYYERSFGKDKYSSQITHLLSLMDLIKSSKKKEALAYLKSNKEILITEKIKPILKAWLSDDYFEAKSYLEKYEYKKEGLALSKIYFHHLALIANFFGYQKDAYEAFNEGLKNLTLDKVRTLYYYSIFLKNNSKFSDKDSFIEKFYQNNAEHSSMMFLKKNFNDGVMVKDFKEGVSELLYNLSETLYGQGMNDTSTAFSQVSLYLNNKNSASKYILAENYQLLGKKKRAIESLKEIKLSNYLGWSSYLKISDLYSDLGNFQKAKEYLKKLIDKDGNRLDVYYKLGEQYHEQKKYNEAILAFSKGIDLINNPSKKHWYFFYSRGMSYERSKSWEQAEKDFLKSLKLFPNQPLVLNYLGYSWIDFGKNLSEAKELIKKAVKLRPNDGYFMDSLGWAFYRMGDYYQAVIQLEKAVEIVPNDPIINDHLGDALWRAGYQNEAIFQWKRALLYKPENDLKDSINYKLEKGL